MVVDKLLFKLHAHIFYDNVALSPSVLYTIGDYLSEDTWYILFRGEAEDNIMCPRINYSQ